MPSCRKNQELIIFFLFVYEFLCNTCSHGAVLCYAIQIGRLLVATNVLSQGPPDALNQAVYIDVASLARLFVDCERRCSFMFLTGVLAALLLPRPDHDALRDEDGDAALR